MVSTRVHRVTMFKLPDKEMQKKLLAAYDVLAKKQAKGGKPYILYLCAGETTGEDERSQGYTVVAKSEFASMEDMRFYDDECAAHGELKELAGTLGLAEKPLTVYFEGAPKVSVP